MPLPQFPDKYDSPEVFSAHDAHAAQARRGRAPKTPPPENVIICFQQPPIQYLIKKHRGRKLDGYFGDFWALRGTRTPIGVAGNFGIGAPAAGVMLEGLIARGARRFIVTGWAGGLHEWLHPGDLVVCDRALRDEGTSHHYLPSEQFALPDPMLTSQMQAALTNLGYAHSTGPSWTTDAPFRETRAEVEHYRALGILTVEMEAAALFAIAQYRRVQCAAAFSVGDSLKNDRWQVDFDRAAMHRGLEKLAEAAVRCLEGR